MKKTLAALISVIMFALFAFQVGYATEDGDVFEDTAAAAEAAAAAAAEAVEAAEKAAEAAADAMEAAKKAASAAAAAAAAIEKAAEAEVPTETAETSAAVGTPPLLADIHQAAGSACSDCHTESPPAVAAPEATCLTCHEDYKDATAGMYEDPHNAHIAFQDCGDCHHIHQESENQCLACHAF